MPGSPGKQRRLGTRGPTPGPVPGAGAWAVLEAARWESGSDQGTKPPGPRPPGSRSCDPTDSLHPWRLRQPGPGARGAERSNQAHGAQRGPIRALGRSRRSRGRGLRRTVSSLGRDWLRSGTPPGCMELWARRSNIKGGLAGSLFSLQDAWVIVPQPSACALPNGRYLGWDGAPDTAEGRAGLAEGSRVVLEGTGSEEEAYLSSTIVQLCILRCFGL